MTKLLNHFKRNAIAYLALFVALGGTSYAAVSLPPGSVGARQIKNHSITPVKFDPTTIGASVRYWARISATGRIIASWPRAKILGWASNPAGPGTGGIIRWGRPIAPSCFSLATAEGDISSYSVSVLTSPGNGATAAVRLTPSGIVPVDVAVICP